MKHTLIIGQYIYDMVERPNGSRYAISTLKLPGNDPLLKYHTATFRADENGEPKDEPPIREHFGSDWEMAQRIHSDHIKWANGGSK